MGMPLREYYAKHTSREITENRALFTLFPWGPEAENHRAGMICSTICNTAPNMKKRDFKPSDFFPTHEVRKKALYETDVEAIESHFKALARIKKGKR